MAIKARDDGAAQRLKGLVLYTRPGCHLCDEMRAGLASLHGKLDFVVREIEVGWEGELAERYGRLLPVLALDGLEICHYFLDDAQLMVRFGANPWPGVVSRD